MAGRFLTRDKLGTTQTGYALKFKPFGSWAKVVTLLSHLKPNVKEGSLRAQTKVATDIIRRVKKHLRAQDLDWVPLSPITAKIKSARGLDPRTLLAYRTYLNSIDVWRQGNQNFIFAGVRRGIYTKTYMGKRSKLEIAQIAAIHEFSNGRKVPRRPLWEPVFREIGGAKGFRRMFVKSLMNHLRVRGVPIKPLESLL